MKKKIAESKITIQYTDPVSAFSYKCLWNLSAGGSNREIKKRKKQLCLAG
jgi:hypothetical protein